MSVNWPDESYVRLYKIDSAHWLMGPWQARAMLPLVLRKLDRAGVMDLGTYGMRWVAKATDMPLEVVEVGMAWWVECGALEIRGQFLVMPNFVEAQECSHSDKARKAEERARRRDYAFAQERLGLDVTNRDQRSRNAPRADATTEPGVGTADTDDDVDEEPSNSTNVTIRDGAVTIRDAAVTDRDEKSRAPVAESQDVTASHSVLCCALLCCAEETSSPVPNDANAAAFALTAPTVRTTQPSRREGRRDLDPSTLTDSERAVHAAIVVDESLRPIVGTPVKLAKDLVRVGPGIDVLMQIAKAGAWLRANPARQKKNGAKFLLGWVGREQDRSGGRTAHSSPNAGPPRQPIAEKRAWKMPEEDCHESDRP